MDEKGRVGFVWQLCLQREQPGGHNVRLKLKLALPYIAVVFLFVIGMIAIVTTFLPRKFASA